MREHYKFTDPTTNKNFRAWFKKSAASKDGKPIVLYHGTSGSRFAAFADTSGPWVKGRRLSPMHFFSSDLAVANTYAGGRGKVEDPVVAIGLHGEDVDWRLVDEPPVFPPGIYRVYLSLQNPYVYDAEGRNWAKLSDPRFPQANLTWDLAQAARDAGFDGLIIRNVMDTGPYSKRPKISDIYVAFRAPQIKSALVNTGAYSPKSADMRRNVRKRRTSRR